MNEYGKVFEKASLKKYSSFGIGGTVKYLVFPQNIEQLEKLVKYLKDKKIKYFVLGNCTNVIIDDDYFDGVVIKLDDINEITINDNEVTASAGVNLPFLVSKCIDNGLTSLYFASMIPGNVGGSIVGNAGCFGHELMQYVKDVTVMDKDGNIKRMNKDEISFGYRYTSLKDKYIVLSVTFILEKGNVEEIKKEIKEKNEKRIASQPLDKKNVGSIFRNPEGFIAGKLIDDLKLKGYMIGGAKISEKHANFIVNEKNASFNDVINLIDFIKDKVKENYDINLVVEPTIIRWK